MLHMQFLNAMLLAAVATASPPGQSPANDIAEQAQPVVDAFYSALSSCGRHPQFKPVISLADRNGATSYDPATRTIILVPYSTLDPARRAAMDRFAGIGTVVARRLTKAADGMNISHLTYGYDADDNMVRITDHVDASRTQNFAYDRVGRLTRVTAASGTTRRTDYLFDGNGNRTRVLTRPLPDDPASAASIDRYALQAGTNRLQGITGPSGTRRMPAATFSQKPAPGGVTVSAGYDGHGRLTSSARAGEASLSHVYNGLDDRVATTTGSDTRRFVYAPDRRVLGEYGSNVSDVKAEFIWLCPMVWAAICRWRWRCPTPPPPAQRSSLGCMPVIWAFRSVIAMGAATL